MSEQTVKLDITIDIDQRDDNADTGLTVAEWNALDDGGRSAVYRSMWDAIAEQDNGGVRVVTEGATSL